MPSNTVAQFADELKMPANVLLEQLRAAGVELSSVDDAVTDTDKAKLLESLRRSHGGGEGKKITLTRRQTSEIRQADGSGRSRTIQVEVRKKRVFVKRDPAELAAEAGAAKAQAPEAPELAPQAAASEPVEPVTAPEVVEAAPSAGEPAAQPVKAEPEPAAEPPKAVQAEPETSTPEPAAEEVPASETVPASEEPAAGPEAAKDAEASPIPVENEATVKAPEVSAEKASAEKPVEEKGKAAAVAADEPASAGKSGRKGGVKPPLAGRVRPPAKADSSPDDDRERARRAAEAEAAALREMLNRPRKVLKAPEADAGGISGTLHKPAGKGAKKDGKPGEVKKVIKASEVSSSWSDDSGRKKAPGRADAPPAAPSRDG